jgi:2-oxo-3-hexenedioate decarboxylase
MSPAAAAAGLAAELLRAYDSHTLLALPSARPGGLSLAQAYATAQDILHRRTARGERVAGWKIGFTNRSLWGRYGVHAPIWGPVWNTTTTLLDSPQARLSLSGLCQPRLEPEIVFGFARAPHAGMSSSEVQSCLAWVAHGFEVVHTHCADWRFKAADTVADFALHGRLIVGPRRAVQDWPTLADDLADLQLTLSCDGAVKDRGAGRAVLDGPLVALHLWLQAMATTTPDWHLVADEVVTTGTLTDAWPLQAGQHWQTSLSDTRLPGLSLRIDP